MLIQGLELFLNHRHLICPCISPERSIQPQTQLPAGCIAAAAHAFASNVGVQYQNIHPSELSFMLSRQQQDDNIVAFDSSRAYGARLR